MAPVVKHSQRGQVLLIVVLVMVVSLTIGLSVISRSITNIRTSTDEASSAEALAAAEAGVQQAIQTNQGTTGNISLGNEAEFETEVNDAIVTEVPLNGGKLVIEDEGVDLWLVPHDANGNPQYNSPWGGGSSYSLSIYWGEGTPEAGQSCEEYEAALEILAVSGTPVSNPASVIATRYAIDPCGNRSALNKFDSPNQPAGNYSVANKSFRNRHNINITNGLLIRIIPIYESSIIAGQAGTGAPALPSQGYIIVSTGTAGDVKRKLNVFQGYSYLPIEFTSYGIFSPTNE